MADRTDTQADIGEILRGIQRQIDLLDGRTSSTDGMVGDGPGDELRELRRATRDRIDEEFPPAE